MQMNRYVSSVSNVFVNNRLLKFAVIVFAGMQLMNYVTTKELQEQQQTVIIPVGLTEKVSVGMSAADDVYLNAMSVYISSLLYSTTPLTIDSQYRALVKLFTPEAYAKYAEPLLQTALNQSKNHVTQTMQIQRMAFQTEPEKLITIELVSDRFIFRDKVDDARRVKLRVGYRIELGTFKITGLEEVRQ